MDNINQIYKERDRAVIVMNKVKLENTNLEIKISELEAKNEQLQQQLKEANEVVEYYSDIDNFDYDYIRNKLEEHNEDGIYSREMCTKAMQYLTKYKVKE